MKVHPAILVLCLSLAACSRTPPEAPPAPAPLSTAPAAATPASVATHEEPPEAILRELMFRQYAGLEAAGGLPVTLTATGASGVIRSRLYEVHKDGCEQLPVDPPGVYECGVRLMVDMWLEGRPEPGEPGEDNKRISVMQDDSGTWIDCTYNNDRDSICHTGRRK